MYTVYILSKTFGRPGKKNVYVFTSPLLCRHHLCHLEGSTKMKVDNWLLKNLFKVPRLREYMGKKQWKQQMKTKIIVFCVYVPYLFWWNNVPDSVCVSSWLIWEMWLYIYIVQFSRHVQSGTVGQWSCVVSWMALCITDEPLKFFQGWNV